MKEAYISYPLTLPQLIVWGAEQMGANKSVVNLCGLVKLSGVFDRHLMNEAINLAVMQHEGLRLRMQERNGDVRQYVGPYQEKQFDFFDFSELPCQTEFDSWWGETAGKSFDLLDCDLFNFSILKLNGDEYHMLFKVHHLIADNWSITLILKQIIGNYQDLQNGIPFAATPKPSFIKYLRGQEKTNGINLVKLVAKFYIEKLTTPPAAIQIIPHLAENEDYTAARQTFAVPVECEEAIKNFAREKHTTILQIFLAGFSLLLALKNKAADIGIGTLFHSRLTPEHMETVGMFVKYIPLRIRVERNINVDAFIKRITCQWLAGVKNQPTQLTLAQLAEIYRKVDYLFDVLLSYESNLPGFPVKWYEEKLQLQPISLMIYIFDRPSVGMDLEFTYRTVWLSSVDIETIHQQLLGLIMAMISNPDDEISGFSLNTRVNDCKSKDNL